MVFVLASPNTEAPCVGISTEKDGERIRNVTHEDKWDTGRHWPVVIVIGGFQI